MPHSSEAARVASFHAAASLAVPNVRPPAPTLPVDPNTPVTSDLDDYRAGLRETNAIYTCDWQRWRQCAVRATELVQVSYPRWYANQRGQCAILCPIDGCFKYGKPGQDDWNFFQHSTSASRPHPHATQRQMDQWERAWRRRPNPGTTDQGPRPPG